MCLTVSGETYYIKERRMVAKWTTIPNLIERMKVLARTGYTANDAVRMLYAEFGVALRAAGVNLTGAMLHSKGQTMRPKVIFRAGHRLHRPMEEHEARLCVAELEEIDSRAARIHRKANTTYDRKHKYTLLDLMPGMCRWPIGEVGDANFRFCGLPSKVDRVYCDVHFDCSSMPYRQPRSTRKINESSHADGHME